MKKPESHKYKSEIDKLIFRLKIGFNAVQLVAIERAFNDPTRSLSLQLREHILRHCDCVSTSVDPDRELEHVRNRFLSNPINNLGQILLALGRVRATNEELRPECVSLTKKIRYRLQSWRPRKFLPEEISKLSSPFQELNELTHDLNCILFYGSEAEGIDAMKMKEILEKLNKELHI